ncbi:MAG: hypothetical protein HYT93_00090 [Parcubacteria group bacterium]|nr:hypothetical protein [Parcubacteria group bacterium]
MAEKNKPVLYTPFSSEEVFRGGNIFFINPEEKYMIVKINNHYHPTRENQKIKIVFNEETRVVKNIPHFENNALVFLDIKDTTISDLYAGDKVQILYDIQDGYFVAEVIAVNPL